MKRKIEKDLLLWKKKERRKPLIVHGARQIGKTYSIREFGEKHYDDFVYVNFEMNAELAADFEMNLEPERLIDRIEIYFGKKINPESTLLFFDEIQTCERALTSLKYFYEEAPQYHIIAAGSLLGITLNREKYSFPVGKVQLLEMFPMDFEEFLWACKQDMLAAKIREHFQKQTQLDGAIHTKAMEQYRKYLVVGGMPEAVATYRESGKLIDVIEIQRNILDAYVADMAKYTTAAEGSRVLACFDSIPAQLAKDNKKFQYKIIQKGGRASLFGTSIDWLSAAGIITKCEKVSRATVPLEAYKELSSFKLYLCDVGLLTLKAGTSAHDIVAGNHNLFTGALTENYVANALEKNGHKLYYWTSGGQAEVDFLLQLDGGITPIEVKSGEHARSRSLSVYRQKYSPPWSIRISGRNFGYKEGIKNIPLYSVHCIEKTESDNGF
ncbi:MAG: ATP-binding protein [Bacillota bacterium]|nr:ATP-binding protein [Bacillota bacterium]